MVRIIVGERGRNFGPGGVTKKRGGKGMLRVWEKKKNKLVDKER